MSTDYAGALMLGGRTRDVLVGVVAHPGGPVEVIAVPSNVRQLPEDSVRASLGTSPPIKPAETCGTHCYRFSLAPLRGAPRRLSVSVAGAGTVRFALPERLPPSAEAMFRRAERRMARLRYVRVHETLSSGKGAVRAVFDLAAPDRLRYVTSAGNRAVVIGATRWDYLDGRWRRSEYQRIRQPAYMWAGAGHARLIGRSKIAGRPVSVLAAFRPDPSYPAWLRLYVTPDRHILRADMHAPAHFMVDRLSAFDAPRQIRPPT